MPHPAAACARTRDGTTAAAARLHAHENGTVPVAERLVFNTGRQACGLRHGLVIVDELDLTATGTTIRHRGTRCDAEDELLIERTADGPSRELVDQRLRRAEDAASRAADILSIDEEAWIAPGNLNQGVVDGIEHGHRLRGAGRLDGGFLGPAIDMLQEAITTG